MTAQLRARWEAAAEARQVQIKRANDIKHRGMVNPEEQPDHFKCDTLSDEQKAMLPIYQDYWIGMSLADGGMQPQHKEIIEKHIAVLYEHAKMPTPQIIYSPSPVATVLAGCFLAWGYYGFQKKGVTDVKDLQTVLRDTTKLTPMVQAEHIGQVTYEYDINYAALPIIEAHLGLEVTQALTKWMLAIDDGTDQSRLWPQYTQQFETLVDNMLSSFDKDLDPLGWGDGMTVTQTVQQIVDNGISEMAAHLGKEAREAFHNYLRITTNNGHNPQNSWLTDMDNYAHAKFPFVKAWATCIHGGNHWPRALMEITYLSEVALFAMPAQRLLNAWVALGQVSGMRFMHERFCIVTALPTVMSYTEQGDRIVPHGDGKPSFAWADGLAMYYLEGIRVPGWLAMTPAEQLDPKKILSEENVEIRRAGIRKMGAGLLLSKLPHKVLAEEQGSSNYRLLEVDLGLGRPERALSMENPSVEGIVHIEWVAPTCETIQQALNFRNRLTDNPAEARHDQPNGPFLIDDSENGVDWQQQGDVVIRRPLQPHEKGYKSRPSQLT